MGDPINAFVLLRLHTDDPIRYKDLIPQFWNAFGYIRLSIGNDNVLILQYWNALLPITDTFGIYANDKLLQFQNTVCPIYVTSGKLTLTNPVHE